MNNQNLENQLYQIDPIFLEEMKLDVSQSCMAFGFECGDGWFKPLEAMITKIAILNNIAKEYNSKFIATQIKSKYGELCVYWDIQSIDSKHNISQSDPSNKIDFLYKWMTEIVHCAEEQCWNTCEICGSTQDLITTNGWITRVCYNCAIQNLKTFEFTTCTTNQTGFLSPYYKIIFQYNNNNFSNIWSAFLFYIYTNIFRKIDTKFDKLFINIIKSNENKLITQYSDILLTDYKYTQKDLDELKNIIFIAFSSYDKLKNKLINTDNKLIDLIALDSNKFYGLGKSSLDLNNSLYGTLLMEVRELFKKENNNDKQNSN